ncbi:hypothetical protein Gotur_034851, partial [Gossypium turneri]
MKHASAHNVIGRCFGLDPIEAELGEGLPSNVIDDDELTISFPYYDQLTAIYAKGRATGKDAQTAADIIEEIDVEDVATTNTHEERNDFYGCKADDSLDDIDLSATQSDHIASTSFHNAATLLAENIRTVGVEINRSIASDMLIQQKSEMTIQER